MADPAEGRGLVEGKKDGASAWRTTGRLTFFPHVAPLRTTPSRLLQLVDHAAKHSVGKAHATHHPSGTRGLSVEFDAALEPILDELVLSFVICEEKRRDSQQSNMGQASGAVEEW